MDPDVEATEEELLLSRLLSKFHRLRREDPATGIGSLRDEAGPLFRRLAEMADIENLLQLATAEEGEEPPQEFGGYRILEQIGEGAAGVVYRALSPREGRTVALKVMRPALSAMAGALERFRQEAQLAGRLDHSHLVRIFESGEVEGRMFIAMELLEGQALSEILGRIKSRCGPLPGEDWLAALDAGGLPGLDGPPDTPAAAYARRLAAALAPVAGALGALADVGIVHRDVKPHNLVLDGAGNLKVTDFGLAKVFGEDLTSTVAVLGTPAYMSPEQARGESRAVDRRSDIYSLGATLYESLTLRYPVKADTFGETLAAIQERRPRPIEQFCPDYPRALSVLIGRCLEKEPRDRYQEPAVLRDDLVRFATSRTVSARPVSTARRVRRLVGRNRKASLTLGGTFALVLIGLLFLATRPAEVAIASIPPGRVTLDGEARGTAPWSGELGSGDHELLITLERFRPHRQQLELSAGQVVDRVFPLVPEDPTDRVALAMLAKAHGFRAALPQSDPPQARGVAPVDGGPWTRRVDLVAPRGRVTRSGVVLGLRFLGTVAGLSWRLVDAASGRVLHREPVAGKSGSTTSPLPASVVAGLAPGRYRVVVTRRDEEGSIEAGFTLAEAAGLDARLAEFPAEIRREPSVRVLAVARLLEDRLYAEAFLAAEVLARELPDRPLPARLALEALSQLGLEEKGVYLGLWKRYEMAKKGS
ncbi:MAG: protein kinase [Planctomycetota bacterium]